MTTIDNELFTFFEDFLLICSKAQFKDFHNKCNSYLYHQLYSDINIQDSKGNTFLHYLLPHALKDTDACNYFYDLLKLGADPFVINKKEQRALPELHLSLSQRFELTDYNNFAQHTVGFHKNFKQLLLNGLLENSSFYMSPDKFKEFLNKNDLFNHRNLIHFVFTTDAFQTMQHTDKKNIQDIIYDKLDYVLTLDRTPEDNSFIVSMLSQSSKTILPSSTYTSNNRPYQSLLLDFFEHSQFDYDVSIVGFITSGIFHQKYSSSQFAQQCLNHLIANLVNNKIDFQNTGVKVKSYTNNYTNNSSFFLNSLISENDPVWKTYISYKLEFDLSKKLMQKNKNHKKMKL